MNCKRDKSVAAIFSTTMLCCCISVAAHGQDLQSRRQTIANQLFDIVRAGGDQIGYSREILAHLDENHNIIPEQCSKDPYNNRFLDAARARAPRSVDAYSLLTGGLAIRESLQLETIRSAGPREEKFTIPLSTLKGPVVKSHPFADMIKGKSFRVYELDRYCPADFYCLHVSNVKKSLELFDYIMERGGALYKRFAPVSIDYQLKEKALRQLAITENKPMRRFYNQVVDEMAVVGSDPFVMQGADITLICKVRINSLFNLTINRYRNNHAADYNARRQTMQIRGKSVDYLFTDDRTVNSYLCRLNDTVVVISNSRKAIETVIATAARQYRTLADEDDYKYMRTIYPADLKKESAFLYLSDAFIRRIVGPEVRIKQARRIRAAVRLAALERYMLYYQHLNNRPPASLDELYAACKPSPLSAAHNKLFAEIVDHPAHQAAIDLLGKDRAALDDSMIQSRLYEAIKKNDPEHAKPWEGALAYSKKLKEIYQKIKGRAPRDLRSALAVLRIYAGRAEGPRFDGLIVDGKGFRARHAEYGSLGHMVPNCDLNMDRVGKSEAAEYEAFLKEYNNFWREFFDPIGIRLNFNDGLAVDTCILPLINNSIYNSLAEAIGGEPVAYSLDTSIKDEIFGMIAKVNFGKLIGDKSREITDELFASDPMLQKTPLAGQFNDQIRLFMLDQQPLVDFDGGALVGEILRSSSRMSHSMAGMVIWSIFHPIRVSIPVKSQEFGERLITAINRFYMKNKAGFSDPWLAIKFYSFTHNKHRVYVHKITFVKTVVYRIYYTVKDGAIHITTTAPYIKKIIDQLKPDKKNPQSKANIAAAFRPSRMLLERDSYRATIIESAQSASFRNAGTLRLFHALFPAERDVPERVLAIAGFKPVCPMGGEYRFDKKTGLVTNSIFGSPQRPEIVFERIDDAAVNRMLDIDEIMVRFEFTREGIRTMIRSR